MEEMTVVNTLVSLLVLALAVVCVGVPVTAAVVVYREELPPLWERVRRVIAFDPRHAGLDYHFTR